MQKLVRSGHLVEVLAVGSEREKSGKDKRSEKLLLKIPEGAALDPTEREPGSSRRRQMCFDICYRVRLL